MLRDSRVHTTMPTADLERARGFYEGVLGFEPALVTPAGVQYRGAGDTWFIVFPSSGRASGSHTQMSFSVGDIAAEVADLKARGVTFEQYDFPGFDQATSIAQAGPNRTAWFRDPDGNLIGLIQFGS
jgi:catechol 2,3-dioxygenase-like lactoylglutathione lyase family enzyme